MRFEQRQPISSLSQYIKSYWWVDSEGDKTIHQQKIVPDGFPELIFHYGDPYKINISGEWQLQGRLLLAGQIRNHFFLENTGTSGMIGIKMQPTAVYELFGIDMSRLVDRVVTVDEALPSDLLEMLNGLSESFEESIDFVENFLTDYMESKPTQSTPVKQSVQHIIDKKGSVRMDELLKESDIAERQLERKFKTAVGLTPKFYSRIIRFTHIFDHIQNNKDWTDITFDTGYYDQAHFIKNFREFTGESPAAYGFDEKNMANFFLFKGD